MKRTISLILALVMVLGFVPWGSLRAFAEVTDETAGVVAQPEANDLPPRIQQGERPVEKLSKKNAFISSAWVRLENFFPGTAIPESPVIMTVSPEMDATVQWGRPEWEPVTDTVFTEEKDYPVTVTLYAPEGYTFLDTNEDSDYEINVGTYWYPAQVEISADGKELKMYASPTSYPQEVRYCYLEGGPNDLFEGIAPQPYIFEVGETNQVEIADVRWVDENKSPVSSLQKGKVYFLEVKMLPISGFVFDTEHTSFELDYCEAVEQVFEGDQLCKAYFYFSTLTHINELHIIGRVPQEGVPVNGLTVDDLISIADDCITVESIRVYDNDAEEYVTEGVFQPNKRYRVEYSLKAKEGYDFFDWVNCFVNGKHESFKGRGDEAVVRYEANTYPTIDRVDVTLTPFTPGMKVSDIVATVPQGANYQVSGIYVMENGSELDITETLEIGKNYTVQFDLGANEGFAFPNECQLFINGQPEDEYSVSTDNLWLYVYESYGIASLDRISLWDLPKAIEPGAAQIPTVDYNTDYMEITGVQWVDANKNPVTSFQQGKLYYLALSVRALGNYGFFNDVEVSCDRDQEATFTILTENTGVAYVRYSLLPIAGYVRLSMNKPREGMNFSDLTCTVLEGEAVLKSIVVRYADSDEEVTETKFLPNKHYLIWYTLEPKDGYDFDYYITDFYYEEEAYIVGGTVGAGSAEISVGLTTYPLIEKVELSVPEMALGNQLGQWVPTVSPDANYYIESYSYDVYNEYEETVYVEDTDILAEGYNYQLHVHLAPKAGYGFAERCECLVNGEYEYCTSALNFPNAYVNLSLNFSNPEIWVEDVPYEIEPGEAPEVYPYSNAVDITDAQWLDANKKSVTTFQDGKIYYLALTCKTRNGASFGEEMPFVQVNGDFWTMEYKKLDSKTAVFYLMYSLEPVVDEVEITVVGFQEGANIANVTATVKGKATVDSVEVWEKVYEPNGENYYINVLSGTFRKDATYSFHVRLKPQSGYRFSWNTIYTMDGQLDDMSIGDGKHALCMDNMSLNPKMRNVDITVGDVAIGKNIDDVAVQAVGSVNYTLNYSWYDSDWNLVTGQFQNGEKYYLSCQARPNNGYLFADDYTEVTVNGEEWSGDYEYPGYIYFVKTYSFLEQIQRVDLPALPKKPSVGQTLPSTLSVGSDKPYEAYVYWIDDDHNSVEKVEKKGIYEMYIDIYPKAGYDFAEDVVVYVDNKLYEEVYGDSEYLNICKAFNVGLPEITKVELTVPVLAPGQLPKVTVPKDAKYTLNQTFWAQSKENNLDDVNDNATELKADLYTFMAAHLYAKDGYAFAENVTFYINGQKVTNMGGYNEMSRMYGVFALGKVGAVTKPLSAPKISVSGETISWTAVANADGYEVYRATSKSGKYSKVTTVTDTSFTDNADGKIYYYKVKAVYNANTKMNSGYSNVVYVTFKVDAPVVTVENDSKGKPKLSWSKVSGASKYTVYRSTNATSGFKSLGTTKSAYYTDSKASAGTTYYYKVIANGSKSSLNSGYSNVVSCNVICGTPTVTVKINTTTGKPSLSWGKVSGAAKYAVYRDGELLATVTAVTYADTTAAIDTQYTYAVQALGKTEALNGAVSKAVTATSGIAKPVVKGTITDQGKPQLTWEAVEGAVKYEVYRSTKSNKGYVLLGDAYSTGVDDMSVAPGKTYYYKVKAIGAVSKSADSSYVKLTGKCATPVITVTNDAKGKPVISWSKVASAKKYTVYRATSEAGKYAKLGTTTKLSYTDTKATPGIVYYYKVIANASKSSYSSGYSNIVGCGSYCGIPVVKVTNAASGMPTFSWSKVAGAVKYQVNYRIVHTGGMEKPFQTIYTTKTSFTPENISVGEFAQVQVVAIAQNEAFSSQPSNVVLGEVLPGTPKITGKVGANKKPVLSWKGVSGATMYEVYRSTSKSKGFKRIGMVECFDDEGEGVAKSYEDLTAVKGKTYYYKVVATNWGTPGAFSNTVKIKSK